jgi:hypothetical protein
MAAPKGNKFAAGNEGGRPLKFKTAKELQDKIDAYFASCFDEVWTQTFEYDDKGKVIDTKWIPVLDRNGDILEKQIRPFTITGLALALDTTRDVLLDYEDREEYSHSIKRAKAIIHNYTEEELMKRDKPTGVIFNLKNNYGWKDKTEQDVNLSGGLADELKAARERAGK